MRVLKWSALVLALLLGIIWPASYVTPLTLNLSALSIGAVRGYLFASIASEPATTSDGGLWKFRSGPQMGAAPESVWWLSRIGSSFERGTPPAMQSTTLSIAYLPTFWLALGSTILVVIAWRPQRRPRIPNHCVHCGYDLTGNVSGRCSECGAVVEKGGGEGGAAPR